MTTRIRPAVFNVYGTVCHICGGPGADTVDHLTSRALGGDDAMDNLRPAHRFCNTGRGARPLPDDAPPRPPKREPDPALELESNPRW